MSTITSEPFDSVTAPAFPSGWIFDSNVVTETTSFNSSPNGIRTSASNSEDVAYFNTTDGNNGYAKASAWFGLGASVGGLSGRVFCRMTVPPTNAGGHYHLAGMTSYGAIVDFSSGIARLFRVAAGTVTNLGTSVSTGLATPGDACLLYCITDGSTITMRLQRMSDSKWLDSAGTYQVGVQDARVVTNTVITGAGFAGISMFQQNAANDKIYADDFLFETVPQPVTRRRCSSTFL